MNKKMLLLLIPLCALIIASPQIAALLFTTQAIPSSGIIASAEASVFSDANCTTPIDSIEWGYLYINQPVNQTIYIKNIGTKPVIIIVETGEPSPVEASVLVFSYNYQIAPLAPGDVYECVLSLTLPQTVSFTTFSFDVIINSGETS